MADIQPIILLLSGGLDSTVLLHHVVRELNQKTVLAISFNYAQRHSKELECAQWQAQKAEVTAHTEIDISFFGTLVKGATTLVNDGEDVPDLSDLADTDLDQPPTYVPNRNMMLLSIAAAYAEAQGATQVFYGAQAHDEYGYWDCTEEFLARINAVTALNRRDSVRIEAPFVLKKKEELVLMGMELGVDFSRTWSCYRGGDRPCNTCPTCVERAKAFHLAGVDDPLLK
jgi:7-cyano-7-deazaguanine synthase